MAQVISCCRPKISKAILVHVAIFAVKKFIFYFLHSKKALTLDRRREKGEFSSHL